MNDMRQPIEVTVIEANLAEHGVDAEEALEALADGWARRRRDTTDERPGEVNYEVLGRSEEGRYLQVVVAVTGRDTARLFHARDMNATERARYKRK